MVAHRAKLQKKPIVFVNLVGGNDGIIFDGASLIADEEGDIILQATAFEEFVETVELDVRKPDARGISGAKCESIQPGACARRSAIMREKNGFEKALIGLSGGIDSALVVAIACEALGPENVLCVMMPSPFLVRGQHQGQRGADPQSRLRGPHRADLRHVQYAAPPDDSERAD